MSADRIAVDTEFLRERTYFPRLCLVQVATADVLAIVDPLTGLDLAPLWEGLLSGAELVLHAATQDLEIVQRHAGGLPERIFDTQVAAAFVGIGDSVGYSKLVDRLLGHGPGRSEAYTDWSRRPLTDRQREYALDDVRWLLQCRDLLAERLESHGRSEWTGEEFGLLLGSIAHSPDPHEQWRRVSGARGLPDRYLPVLREVTAWREREAVRRDIPRQRVVADRVLVEIARRAPGDLEQLKGLRGMPAREAERSARWILAAVQTGQELPREEWPAWPQLPALGNGPTVDALASLLDAVMRTLALDLEISSRLLGTRADLERLVKLELAGSLEQDAGDVGLLTGWRYEVAGRHLVEVLRGGRAARVERRGGELHLVCERA